MLDKDSTEQPVNTNQTIFKSLSTTMGIKNGVADTNDLLLVAPSFISTAQGSVQLAPRTLDFKLQIKPQLENVKIHFGIPVLISGELHHPDVRLDTVEVQKILAEIELDKLKEKCANKFKSMSR